MAAGDVDQRVEVPHAAELRENTTWDLVKDIEKLRTFRH